MVQCYVVHCFQVTTSGTGTPISSAMKPTMEKMTNPAKTEVPQFATLSEVQQEHNTVQPGPDHQGVPQAVVAELVVAGEGEQGAKAHPQ